MKVNVVKLPWLRVESLAHGSSDTGQLKLLSIRDGRVQLNTMKCLMKAFFVSLLLALALQVRATTLVYKSFDDLVKEADGIVMGSVTNIESRKDARGRIYTYVTLGDLQMLHNRYEGKDFTLVMEGGRVGNEIAGIEGSPQFEYKQRVILFVQGNGREIVPLVGWEQGVFRVQKDPESGQEIISDSEGNRVLA